MYKSITRITGDVWDLLARTVFCGEVVVENGKIKQILKLDEEPHGGVQIVPLFVDSHMHIESTMLEPQAAAALALVHGTGATVSDPHEIANVCGVRGIDWMIERARGIPLKIYFGAPSCVPAAAFEKAGAIFNAQTVCDLLDRSDIYYLAEVMNFPAVLAREQEFERMIAHAKLRGKPIDGHAPGLQGEDAARYAAAGIKTDHECTSLAEALGKLECGMMIAIREGSAARNFENLRVLLDSHPDKVMFCTDDKHPHELREGHINLLVSRAIAEGHDPMAVLCAACLNPVKHYGLELGLLQVGDSADFAVLESLESGTVLKTVTGGKIVAESGESLFVPTRATPINHFVCGTIDEEAFRIPSAGTQVRCIGVIDGELITVAENVMPRIEDGALVSDVSQDMLKLCLVCRYDESPTPVLALVRNFGLQRGAIASSVSHDSHNVLAVGVSDEEIASAVNAVIEAKGGIAVCEGSHVELLPLPVAGLMSLEPGEKVADDYERLLRMARRLGTELHDPFMTLSFLGLPVIPELKLSAAGLCHVTTAEVVSLWVE